MGALSIFLGTFAGAVGILLFLVISQDYEADKIFHFESSSGKYEVRRYSFGFATFEDTRYTFATYREYSYLPFEKKIDETNFFDTKTNVSIDEDELKITLKMTYNKELLVF